MRVANSSSGPGEEAQVLTIARRSSVRHANQIPFETG
jgi:hypothetical protein